MGWKRALLQTRAAFFVCHLRAISESHRQILSLGIDHTPIVVSDTEASGRFYRDLLGMGVAGECENHGTEQAHLNNVFGTRLCITALPALAARELSLLEFLAPHDRRPFPFDEHANDLAHRLCSAKIQFVSSGVIANQNGQLGFSKAFAVRDPDGHAIEIEQK